ncbi:hypothetical protein [Streptomyces cyaneus]|uniref:hypothetical protein n=1 Tax=Streptomyces cyaneus TaxID=1904 RepID=UPI000FF8A08A|nr:hypothetical protein [Streptomyces cyaneus]
MNDFQDRGSVHQVVFRWDGNHGRQGTGMNAVAHSCEADRAEELGRELGPLLWVSGAAAARPSVVRTLSRDGEVLLVRRWPTTDPGGRPSTVSHVLIGAPGTLKVRQCLGLAYRGWGSREKAETVTGKQDMIECAQLDAVALRRLPTMVEQLPTVKHALTHMAAEWLRDPAQRMSLLVEDKQRPGWPDQDAVPLVYLGLFLLFGAWPGHEWTFATYDTADTHPLRLMSVPRWEADAGGPGPLARVMAGKPSGRRFELWAAAELVKHLLAHPEQGAGVPQLVEELPDGASLNWERRRAHLKDILGADRTSGTMPTTRDREPDRAGEPSQTAMTAPQAYQATTYEAPYGTPYTNPDQHQHQHQHRYPHPSHTPTSPPPPHTPPQPLQQPSPQPYQQPLQSPASPNGHDVYALHRDLLDTRHHGDGMRRSLLMARLGEQPDDVLLDELRSGELPPESLQLVLKELGQPDRIDGRHPEMQHALCAEVLQRGLYFAPQGPAAEHTSKMAEAENAAHLFTWAVAPLAQDRRHLPALGEVLHLISLSTHPTAFNWLQKSIIEPANGQVPNLPPELWSQLLRDALSRPDRQSTAPPSPPLPSSPPQLSPLAPESRTWTGRFSDLANEHPGRVIGSALCFCLIGALVTIAWFFS